MESKWPETGTYTLHIRHRWKFHGFYWQKDHEQSEYPGRLAMGGNIYIINYDTLAFGGACSEYPFWTVFFLYKIYQEDRGKNGICETGARKSESENLDYYHRINIRYLHISSSHRKKLHQVPVWIFLQELI